MADALGAEPEVNNENGNLSFKIGDAVFSYDAKHLTIDLYNCENDMHLSTYGNKFSMHANKPKNSTQEYNLDSNTGFFNEDDSVNLANVENLIESGEMSIGDFIKACGRNHDSIGYTRSNTFSYSLEDGTQIKGCDYAWGDVEEVLNITTPDGKVLIAKPGFFNSADEKSRIDEYRNACFGENNVINPEEVQKLIDSGEMSPQDFIKMCDYQAYKQYEFLADDNSYNARIPELYSYGNLGNYPKNEFQYAYFYDNTKIQGLRSDFVEGEPFLSITTGDGKNYVFNYKS